MQHIKHLKNIIYLFFHRLWLKNKVHLFAAVYISASEMYKNRLYYTIIVQEKTVKMGLVTCGQLPCDGVCLSLHCTFLLPLGKDKLLNRHALCDQQEEISMLQLQTPGNVPIMCKSLRLLRKGEGGERLALNLLGNFIKNIPNWMEFCNLSHLTDLFICLTAKYSWK